MHAVNFDIYAGGFRILNGFRGFRVTPVEFRGKLESLDYRVVLFV